MLFSLGLSGCATVNVPHLDQGEYKIEDDERRLFKRSEEAIEIIDNSDFIYPNPKLETYLTGLAVSLLPDDFDQQIMPITVRVLNEPSLNAFAMPNGRIYIHLGILAAAENEAQLAALIAHEMTHILYRHQLTRFRALVNQSAFWNTIALPMSVAGGLAGSVVTQLGYMSSISGYSKDQEFEADEHGFQMMLQRGYDVREGPKMFENLKIYLEDEDVKQPFFFSSHPAIKSRIRNFKKLVKETPRDEQKNIIKDTDIFESFIGKILEDQTKLCLQEGYFITAKKTIERYIQNHQTQAQGYYYLGEIYRQWQGNEKGKKADGALNETKAIEAYDEALNLKPSYAPAIEGKARVLWLQGQKDEAKELFRQYLNLSPEASDRMYIKEYLK